jgi:hypothetical protein
MSGVGVTWDMSEVGQLAADLGKGNARVVRDTRTAIEVGARAVQKAARKRVTGLAHAPGAPDAITFDVHGLEAEIGYDKGRRQGALGNILEYGTAKNGPIPALGPGLAEAGPAYVEAIIAAAVRHTL